MVYQIGPNVIKKKKKKKSHLDLGGSTSKQNYNLE